MKKILFVWLSVWSVLMIWSLIIEIDSNNPTTSITDRSGKEHVYQTILFNKDNWCILHEKYEVVKRSISSKNKHQRIFTRKNEKTSDLV